ncbi:retinol dehydrogenase 12-like [Anthonomus grandis grandis]|uniref:retinol dehydrogenase 12-like n=1 Tax=Anthonomus grandis grandis TaxID=2921223 RepID=UPI00216586C9|nr:retinol dehydrogenase 12-like [Anthonomus grandis grandis]
MIFFILCILFIFAIVKIIFQSTNRVYLGPECLNGKIAVVTGGNRGIGFEVSKSLASRGCTVIIACRSKAENERRKLIEITRNENIFVQPVDLKSFKSVRDFAKEVHKMVDKIDILINNAGIGSELGLTEDGLHPVLQCNTFSPFLLTHLLVDLLKKSDDARIVFSSSVLAFLENLTPENLMIPASKNTGSMVYFFTIYGTSKLAEIIISNKLSEKLQKYGIKSNALHPGFINTDIWKSLEIKPSLTAFEYCLKYIFYVLLLIYSKNTQDGAQGIIELATSSQYKNISGQFYWGFGMNNIYPNPTKLKNAEFCNAIWNKLEEIVKLKPEEVLK